MSKEANAWLRKADSDLRTVDILMRAEEPPYDSVCFHAQQAAEKCLKALLTAYMRPFPKTHDLNALANLLPAQVVAALGLSHEAWAELSYFAVGSRYPDDGTTYDWALAARLQARALEVAWAASQTLTRMG